MSETTTTAALRHAIQRALHGFIDQPLAPAALALLDALGYRSDKSADFGHDAETLLSRIEQFRPELAPLSRAKVQADRWKSCAFLFQLTDEEIPALARGGPAAPAPRTDSRSPLARGQIESFVFLAIDLQGEAWPRSQLALIVRELNRGFPMPAILLFRQEGLFSLAVIDRRQHLRDPRRDVIDSRITVIKDLRLASPHRAHIDVLLNLALPQLGGGGQAPASFRALYDAWIDTLSTQKLNAGFYQQLAWWYAWALKEVQFPKGGGAAPDTRNAIAVIRLLTRLIFVWFIKERGLVPDALFARDALRRLLKQPPDTTPDASNYYHAILQNLFFATLNQEQGPERRWAQTGPGMKADYLIPLVYRHKDAFLDPDAALQDCFAQVPFLNGGLFECLDAQLSDDDLSRRPDLKPLVVPEGRGWALRIDGFSRRPDAQAQVPNKLFFGGTEDAALDTEFGTTGKRYPVKGLIDLLDSYKFTVDENTPLDEEVALDPELLGKVFENLLASYNPDTQKSARKESGSFYTPREVVDYMVDEALITYFAKHLPEGEAHEPALRQLLSHAEADHAFTPDQADALVHAIEQLKVFDPACGSGAFPMGILAKLFAALKKLDPDNRRWRAQNLAPLEQRLAHAQQLPDPVQRDTAIEDARAALTKYEHDFADPAYADYTRKLHLIEKCIFGADIQPIAVQIAKLRVFIALIVSQPIDRSRPNWGIPPLPNLETKIVAANTLFGIHRAQGQLVYDDITATEAELRAANAAYFSTRTRATKKRRKETVQRLHEQLVTDLKKGGLVGDLDAERMAHWDPFDQNRSADFFDVEWMFGLPCPRGNSEAVFDIVIANPPYVRQEAIKDIKPLLKDAYHYQCYSGTADLFVYFYERAVTLLKPHGVLSFISSNKWYRAKYGEALRQYMATHTRLRQIIDFGDTPVFTAIAYPTLVIATRRQAPQTPAPPTDQVRVLNWAPAHPVETFPAVFHSEAFTLPQAELAKDAWQLEPPAKRSLLARIRRAGTPLGHYVKGRFYYGIKTGLNEAFVIDAATRAKLIAQDPNSAQIIKPFLRGRDVKRWRGAYAERYLIKIESSDNVSHSWSGKKDAEAEKVFSKIYPAIYAHFKQHRQVLINRYDQGRYFWELRACAYWQEFEQPKIIVPAIAAKPSFAPDTSGYYCNNKNTIYVLEHLYFALGVLNSNVNSWLSTQVCSSKQNGFYDFEPRYSSQLIVPFATDGQQLLVEAIAKVMISTADPLYERLLDGLVYELFFPDELHAASIHLFTACEQAGAAKLASLHGEALAHAAQTLATTLFAQNHPLSTQLASLQHLDLVRLIEAKD